MKKLSVSYLVLNLSLALMFIALGISGISSYNSGGAEIMRGLSQVFGGRNSVIPLVFSIVQLVAGILLVLNIFNIFPSSLTSILLLVIFIFWCITILLNYFANGFMKPNFVTWLGNVSVQLVILSSLWIVFRGTSRL